LEKVIAFSFGNHFPLDMACQFFAACSSHPLHLVRQQFSYMYYKWSQYPCNSKCRYYDLAEAKWKYT
jgi:hypothetical protein